MASGGLQFRAFISYSHRDKRWAAWLHRALETYRVPRHLVGRETSAGLVGSRIGKIFRDRDELAVSADLSGEINEALKNTQFLVVLCSPASAKSQWVNQEIINFKRLKGEASIICVIADGEPYASLKPGMEDQECFAPALRYQVKADGTLSDSPAEPVAADLRPHADGKRRAKLKVIAGLLDVGLDELVQRENQRYRRRMAMLSAASIAGVITLSTLTYNAIVARDLAEQRLAQAEGFVEYMIGDLRENLEPIGRLDVLDSVSSTALDYYAAMNPDDMNADSLARRSRAFHMLGEIQDLKGDLEAARTAFSEAKQTTEELLARDPDNTQRIYDHAQSVFWVGYSDWQRGQIALAEKYFLEYRDLARNLVELEPNKLKWQTEVGHANNNLGVISLDRGNTHQALSYFEKSVVSFRKTTVLHADNTDYSINYAQTLAWLAEARRRAGNIKLAYDTRLEELQVYEKLQANAPRRVDLSRAILVSKTAIGKLSIDAGNISNATHELNGAVDIAKRLTNSEPSNLEWKELEAAAELSLGLAKLYAGQLEQSKNLLDQSLLVSKALVAEEPELYRWRLELEFPSKLAIAQYFFRAHDLENSQAYALALLEDLNEFNDTTKQLHGPAQLKAETLLLLGDAYFNKYGANFAQPTWKAGLESLEISNSAEDLASLRIEAVLRGRLGEFEKSEELQKRLDQSSYKHPERFNTGKIKAVLKRGPLPRSSAG